MRGRGIVGALGASILVASCAGQPGVIEVAVDGEGQVTGVRSLRVIVTHNAMKSKPLEFSIPGESTASIPPVQTLSLTIPPERQGAIRMDIDALNDDGAVIASAWTEVTVDGKQLERTIATLKGCSMACALGQVCLSGKCEDNRITCQGRGIKCNQPACYENGRYLISAGKTIVVDLKNGGRLWSRAKRGPKTHFDAETDCKQLVLEGINGWRLPSYVELASTLYMAGALQGCPTCDPAIDQAAFNDTLPAAAGEFYFSATYVNDAWQTCDYCSGRNVFSSNQPEVFRCTHDPL